MATRLAPLYFGHQIRQVEQAAPAGGPSLMERAGAAAGSLAQQLLGSEPNRPGRDVLVIAGPGNNGGDAFECAWHLKRGFFRVSLVFAGEREKLPQDALRAMDKWQAAGGTLLAGIPPKARWDLVIDGLFGIGLSRPLSGRHAELVQAINALGVPILALDAPSGLNGDTGAVMGSAVRASHTLTFIARKPGLLTLDGPDHCGELHVDVLGLDARAFPAPEAWLLDASVLQGTPRRPANFHKGMAGDAGIIGGAEGMVGAALIAGRAALRTGAGRVLIGFLAPQAPGVDMNQPELMMRKPAQLLEHSSVLLLGPGMGTSRVADRLLREALAAHQPLVLDADALNLIAADARLLGRLVRRRAAVLMTPHPAEAARLLSCGTREVQQDRIAAAKALAARYNSLVVLKGQGSILADAQGRCWINPTGNAGMASAGMGDALSGILVSLLAQGVPPLEALQLGVWVHGAAGDELLAEGRGPLGITASEIIARTPLLLNRALRLKNPLLQDRI